MAKYVNGDFTYRAIANAGKKLFYLNGYITTHCKDIAIEAGINPGLIHYHYKTKGNIAQIVITELLLSIREAGARICVNESLLVRNAVEHRILWYLCMHVEEVKRFVYEISGERIPHKISEDIGKEYFAAMNAEYPVEQNKDKLNLLSRCSFAVQSEILMSYVEGKIDLPEDAMADLEIRTMFELLTIPYERINEILERSKEIYYQLEVKYLPNFVVDIEMKGEDSIS